MSEVLSVRVTSAHEQRMRIAHEADAKQDQATGAVLANGFAIDWGYVLADITADEPLRDIRGGLLHDLRTSAWFDAIEALAINGAAIAAWTHRKNEALAGFKEPPRVLSFAERTAFAEPQAYTPSKAIQYWQKFLGLDSASVDKLASIDARRDAAKMADRIANELMARLTKLHEQSAAEGLPLSEFIKQAREIAPDASRSLLETEYRTHLSTVYGQQLRAQIEERSNAFPFMQFMIVNDNRTTWYICLPMGTSGPAGTGYICATGDPVTIKWRTPAHFACRSMWSPISYLEAQRLRILAKDGRTKIAIVGSNPNRPYGDPPTFAENPNGNGDVRKVEPQKGFGG